MKYLLDVLNEDGLNSLRTVVVQDLNEIGIRVEQPRKDFQPPTIKKSKSREDSLNIVGSSSLFGISLELLVPAVTVTNCGPVPKFLADAIKLLGESVEVEGLFRKSGSVNRLKELRARAETGDIPTDAQPLDVAGLVKQFLRELPEPLLTTALYDVFIQCVGVPTARDLPTALEALLLACLLLPAVNLATLRYIALFLSQVAAASDKNRMDAANIAVCLAPNILYTTENTSNGSASLVTGSLLTVETSVVRLLIEHASHIGMISDGLLQRVAMLGSCFPREINESNISSFAITKGSNRMPRKKKKVPTATLR